MTSKDQAETNIREFMDKYGKTGFLELYFTNYLLELLMAYIRSHSKKREFDGGYQYHFGGEDRLITPDEEREFRRDLKRACAEKAKMIVSELQTRGILSEFDVDIGSITQQATDMVNRAIKEVFESVLKTKWEED